MRDDGSKAKQTAEFVKDISQANSLDMDGKPFASLMRNEADLRRTFKKIESAIHRSVAVDVQRSPLIQVGQRSITRAELKHRFKICEAWIRRARGDLGLSLEKTLDLLPHALRSELDGNQFDPNTLQTNIWSPT